MIPSLIAILAISDDDVIGVDGKLPWHLPEDLARFKTKTSGHAIIMGSKTIFRRLERGWSVERALTAPLRDAP